MGRGFSIKACDGNIDVQGFMTLEEARNLMNLFYDMGYHTFTWGEKKEKELEKKISALEKWLYMACNHANFEIKHDDKGEIAFINVERK